MGKHTKELNAVNAHDHFKSDGTVDQDKAMATVEAMLALWKSGATKVVDGHTWTHDHQGKTRYFAQIVVEEV